MLAKGRLRAKQPQLCQALECRVQPHHRFLIAQILTHVDFLAESIEQVQAEIEQRLRASYQEEVQLLLSISSIKLTSAATIISEIGVDMLRFPSEKHLASWAGICPGNKESGGKRLER